MTVLNEKTNTRYTHTRVGLPSWNRSLKAMVICILPTAYTLSFLLFSLILLHLIHRLPRPGHPVFLTGNFFDRLLVTLECFQVCL